MPHPLLYALRLLLLATPTLATTWSAILFTYHGERTPGLSSDPFRLTSLGATQMFNAGTFMRERYLTGSSSRSGTNWSIIDGISTEQINNEEITVLSRDESYVSNGATAFMQGLYPASSTPETLGDGTQVTWPLNGYQYPDISTISANDYNHIWLAGNNQCPSFTTLTTQLLSTSLNTTTTPSASTIQSFYTSQTNAFPDVDPYYLSYAYATDLYEYAQWQYNHNATYLGVFAPNSSAMTTLQDLASQQSVELSSPVPINETSSNYIPTIAGQTLAAYVVGQIQRFLVATERDIASQPAQKLSVVFGTVSPMLAFFSLASLTTSGNTKAQFTGLPLHGSVMGFELFSDDADESDSTTTTTANSSAAMTSFPSNIASLYIRFLFRNGTDPSSTMTSYPLFNRGNSQTDMPLADFLNDMQDIALGDVWAWCKACEATTLYCNGIEANLNASTDDPHKNHHSKSVSAAVGGVIGAMTTLAVLALVALLLALIFRHRRRSQANRAGAGGSAGGFKGAEKRSSDIDVADDSFIGSNASAAPRGHERIGSWELKDGKTRGLDGAIGEPARVKSMADYGYGRESEDGTGLVDPYGRGVQVKEGV